MCCTYMAVTHMCRTYMAIQHIGCTYMALLHMCHTYTAAQHMCRMYMTHSTCADPEFRNVHDHKVHSGMYMIIKHMCRTDMAIQRTCYTYAGIWRHGSKGKASLSFTAHQKKTPRLRFSTLLKALPPTRSSSVPAGAAGQTAQLPVSTIAWETSLGRDCFYNPCHNPSPTIPPSSPYPPSSPCPQSSACPHFSLPPAGGRQGEGRRNEE
eukprot:jgi/Botrbrau1/8398/Bobra.0237s0019.1